MRNREIYRNGQIVEGEVYDNQTRTVTVYVDGEPSVRPYTEDENAEADAEALRELFEQFGSVEKLVAAVIRAVVGQTDPDSPPAWVQPTGAHDAYLPGAIVSHNGTRWQNALEVLNVWEPGSDHNAGWVDLDAPDPGENWAVGVTYLQGQEVLYDGVRYVCLQGHTSLVGWEPPNVPSLWAVV